MDQSASALSAIMGLIVPLGIIAFCMAALWRVFEKAGEPGWIVLIPLYNIVVLLKIASKPWWWMLLMLIPFVNFIVVVVVSIGMAKNFGRGPLFGLGLGFLGVIFYPILAFGDAEYAEVC